MKKAYTLKLDTEAIAAIKEIKARDGIPQSEQIRRGIAMWLKSRGVRKAERQRAEKRRRS